MSAVARVGDRVTHDQVKFGTIAAGASRTLVEGQPVARQGDVALCPEHGPQPIASGSTTVRVEGQPAARVGDTLACGAAIASGADRVSVG